MNTLRADFDQPQPGACQRVRQVAVPRGVGAGLAVVNDLDQERALLPTDPDAGVLGRRMAQHVGQALLHDPITGMANRRRDGLPGRRHLQVNRQPG